MKNKLVNYETLLNLAKNMSMSKEPEEVTKKTVENIKDALDIKGCALFFINRDSGEMELAASKGLGDDYLKKGPVSAAESIPDSLRQPVAIYDVTDDPRLQYPKEATAAGIASILSVPIFVRGNVTGALRVYTSEKWEFTLDDVNFVQALAQITGMYVDMCRVYQGQSELIDVFATTCESQPL